MKLLMITGDRSLAQGKRGAFWNTLSELHKHFKRIDVITPRVPVHRYDMVLFGNVHVHPSPFPLVFQWLWVWYKGHHLVKEQGHDVMTAHEYAPVFNGVGARLIHRTTGIPYMLEVLHVTGVPRAGNPWELMNRWLFRLFVRVTARKADAVRVMNGREVPEVLVTSGVPRSKIVLVPAIYVDQDIFKPMDEPKRYDVLFVGRLARNKGLRLFMDMAGRAELRAMVVGDGPLKEWAQNYAVEHRVSVHFHGFAEDQYEIARLMNGARLLCMFSDSEGGPRVVPEALSCGTPVLATPVGIVPDVLPPEAIEEWDAEALADKARNILSDDMLYARLRQAGLLSAERFEKKAAIANYANELKKLANGH